MSVIDGRSCSQLDQSARKPSVDACQPLSIGSGYSRMFHMFLDLPVSDVHL